MGTPSGSNSSGRLKQQLLAVGEVSLLDVDAPVGDHPARHLHRPGPLGAAGEQLAADRVAHVVGEQRQTVDSQCGHVGGGDVGLERHGVGPVGLGREPVAQHVEQEHPAPRSQAVEHGRVVERRGREAVEHQQRRVALGPDGGHVDREDALAPQSWRCSPIASQPALVVIVTCRPACSPRERASPRRRTRSTSRRSRTRPGATRARPPSRRACR